MNVSDKTTRQPITLLYVPGDRPERIQKAYSSDADVVIIDLEDAVAPSVKVAARETMVRAVREGAQSLVREGADRLAREGADRAVQVRINASGSPWQAADLAHVADLPDNVGVRLPKAEDPAVVAALADMVRSHPLHLLLESALGIERAGELARCHPAIASISLGEADLRADLGVSDPAGLLYARSRVVCAAAAAGLPSPTMSAFTDVRNLDGLESSTREGRRLGFLGRTAIHPGQLATIRAVFLPSADEVARAREVLAAAGEGEDTGAAVALPDGRFVDAAVIRQARRLLSTLHEPDAS